MRRTTTLQVHLVVVLLLPSLCNTATYSAPPLPSPAWGTHTDSCQADTKRGRQTLTSMSLGARLLGFRGGRGGDAAGGSCWGGQGGAHEDDSLTLDPSFLAAFGRGGGGFLQHAQLGKRKNMPNRGGVRRARGQGAARGARTAATIESNTCIYAHAHSVAFDPWPTSAVEEEETAAAGGAAALEQHDDTPATQVDILKSQLAIAISMRIEVSADF
jgi:hypothetical protein